MFRRYLPNIGMETILFEPFIYFNSISTGLLCGWLAAWSGSRGGSGSGRRYRRGAQYVYIITANGDDGKLLQFYEYQNYCRRLLYNRRRLSFIYRAP